MQRGEGGEWRVERGGWREERGRTYALVRRGGVVECVSAAFSMWIVREAAILGIATHSVSLDAGQTGGSGEIGRASCRERVSSPV